MSSGSASQHGSFEYLKPSVTQCLQADWLLISVWWYVEAVINTAAASASVGGAALSDRKAFAIVTILHCRKQRHM